MISRICHPQQQLIYVLSGWIWRCEFVLELSVATFKDRCPHCTGCIFSEGTKLAVERALFAAVFCCH